MEVTASRGQRIAQRFELDSLLSDVGLGECWSAHDLQRPDSPAQVEFLSPPGASGAATREAFDALVARMRPVSNPGILGVLGGGEVDGRLFLVTERLEGRSLANWLAGHRQVGTRPGLTVVQRIFDKACNAMQFAHAVAPQPVVHRALTPRSILLRRVSPGQHHVKVGDFGLAPFSPGARAGSIGAWWEYQAPEQHGGRWNDPPTADVFALAVVLVEMLSLAAMPRAEGRETWWQFIKESRGNALERLVLLRDDVPRGVWEVIAAAMKQSPKERTPSVQRFQRALRDAWQAAGEWQTTAGTESEPPVPTSLGDASSLVRSAPGGGARAATVIDGWQAAERRQAPDPMPARPSMPDPIATRPSAPSFTPPVNPAPTMPMAAMTPPPPARPVTESTEMIDLARHGAFMQGPQDAQVRQDSTMALDISSLDPQSYGAAASLFGEAFEGDSDLDPSLGTQVMSQGVRGGTEPPPPAGFDDVPPPDASNTTRAIDTAEAFAQLDAYARRKPPPEAMATLKAPVRSSGGFNPVAPRRDLSGDADLRATTVMKAARPPTLAPGGFVSPAADALSDASGDPFARDSFAGDPFAHASPSSPPVEPTMAVPIEAMMAGAQLPYGHGAPPGAHGMPALRPSTPDPMALPPMHTPFAMGAPPRVTESLPPRAPAATILGQPAWIMITIGALLVVCVGASAFLLAGGR
ncbi:MAG: protein kinase [Deltaproteobacteria bacterium]|nr:protein kinase [Myxococcales bacterium]MDP3214723.1 protein kinase [Deltaproteobacteria bacterium]